MSFSDENAIFVNLTVQAKITNGDILPPQETAWCTFIGQNRYMQL